MKIWYDTEFLEDGKTIELISIGMIREDGKEYYAVNGDMDCVRVGAHPWLKENVVKHLPGKNESSNNWTIDNDHADVKPLPTIRHELEAFLFEAAAVSELELWSWFSAYDHVALCQLWGPMVRKPFYIPHYTNDVRQEFQRWNNPAVPGHLTQDDMPDAHNALADAKYHKRLHQFIAQLGKERYREAVLEALHPELGYWCDLDNLHKEKN